MINKVKLEIVKFKDAIFDGRSFEKNNNKINKSIIGETKISDNRMESVILLNQQYKQLMFLRELKLYQKWDLVYRANRDGFESVNFHSKCDDKSNTSIVIYLVATLNSNSQKTTFIKLTQMRLFSV